MPTIYLRGANITAQWYADNYSGTTFPRVDKFLLHTTETGGWPGYSAGASAPNATYYPKFRQTRQHFGINRSARALRDPSSTAVRENRDNVFQLEIICYSDYRLAVERGGLWVGDLTTSHMRDIAAMILQIHRDWNLPLQSSVTWREGRQTWYDNVRLTGSQFDAYRGILGHVHASGNTHWDPGGFRYSRLKAALDYQLVNHPVYGGGGVVVPPPPPPDGGIDPEDDLNEQQAKQLADIHTLLTGATAQWPAKLMDAMARVDSTMHTEVTEFWPSKLMPAMARVDALTASQNPALTALQALVQQNAVTLDQVLDAIDGVDEATVSALREALD
jgi:hypothetical protein